MPLLRWTKLRLGQRLDSDATSGEGVQNLLCAAQALAALTAVIAAGAGIMVIDPLAALLIAGIAAKEGGELWRRRVRLPHHPRPRHDLQQRLRGRLLPRVTTFPAG